MATYTCQVPESISGPIRSITMRKLSSGEEIMAGERVPSEKREAWAWERVIAALVKVGEREVTWTNGSARNAIEDMDPKLRALCLQMFLRLHNPSDDEAKGFFDSMTVEAS